MDRSTAAVLILVIILQGVGTDLFYNQAMDTCSVYQTAKIVRAKQLVVLSTRSFMVDINGFQEDLQSAASMAAAATTKLHKMEKLVEEDPEKKGPRFAKIEAAPYTAGMTVDKAGEEAKDDKFFAVYQQCYTKDARGLPLLTHPWDLDEMFIQAAADGVTEVLLPVEITRHGISTRGGQTLYNWPFGLTNPDDIIKADALGYVVASISQGIISSVAIPTAGTKYVLYCEKRDQLDGLNGRTRQASQHIINDAISAMERLTDFVTLFNTEISGLKVVKPKAFSSKVEMPESNMLDAVNSHLSLFTFASKYSDKHRQWVTLAKECTEWIEEFLTEYKWVGNNLAIQSIKQLGSEDNGIDGATSSEVFGIPIEVTFDGKVLDNNGELEHILVSASFPAGKGNRADIYDVQPFYTPSGQLADVGHLAVMYEDDVITRAFTSSKRPTGEGCQFGVIKEGPSVNDTVKTQIYCKRLAQPEDKSFDCGHAMINSIKNGMLSHMWDKCPMKTSKEAFTPIIASQCQNSGKVVSVAKPTNFTSICPSRGDIIGDKNQLNGTLDSKYGPVRLDVQCKYFIGDTTIGVKESIPESGMDWSLQRMRHISSLLPKTSKSSSSLSQNNTNSTAGGNSKTNSTEEEEDWTWKEYLAFIIIPIVLAVASTCVSICIATAVRKGKVRWNELAFALASNGQHSRTPRGRTEEKSGARHRCHSTPLVPMRRNYATAGDGRIHSYIPASAPPYVPNNITIPL